MAGGGALEAALAYAAQGWPVIPCKADKAPACPHGLRDATSDPDALRQLWARHSGEAIGIVVPDGALVLDVDRHEALGEMNVDPADWPGPVACTPRGGWHLLCLDPRPVGQRGNKTGRLPAGVDVRAGGRGYIVAPPGVGREWARPLVAVDALPECPPVIAELLMPEPCRKRPTSPRGEPDRDLGPYVRTALEREAQAVREAVKGQRNGRLNRAAFNLGQLCGAGLDHGDAERELLAAALDAGLGERESRKSFASGWRSGEREPRDVPPPNHGPGTSGKSGGGGSGTRQPAEAKPPPEPHWPALQPLPDVNPPVPDLEPEMLPEPLRTWLTAKADEMCVPLGGLAAAAMVGLSTVVGRAVEIAPHQHSAWRVVPNLWGALVAPPGLLKSPTLSAALEPMDPMIRRARDQYEAEEERMRPRQIVLQSRLNSAKRKKDGADAEEIRQLLAEIEECRVAERQYVVQDVTVERLQEIQADNPRGVLYLRDELAGLFAGFDRSGHEQDRPYLLEGWDGNRGSRTDRIGRGATRVEFNCLSLFGTIQPSRIAPLVQGVIDKKDDDGLLQRMQMLVFIDRLPEWKEPGPNQGSGAVERVTQIFDMLNGLLDETNPKTMRFTPEGQSVFKNWRAGLEARLKSGDLGEGLGSHLAKYRSLMPSLAGLLHLVELMDTAIDGAPRRHQGADEILICADCARLAVKWCDFLEAHARRLYGAVAPGADKAHALARAIILGLAYHGMTIREAYRAQWAGLRDPEHVREGLSILDECGWARLHRLPTGGRPTEVVHLHPAIRDADLSSVPPGQPNRLLSVLSAGVGCQQNECKDGTGKHEERTEKHGEITNQHSSQNALIARARGCTCSVRSDPPRTEPTKGSVEPADSGASDLPPVRADGEGVLI
jgi:putative DNA primase/helicase